MAKSYIPKNASRKAKKKYVGIAAFVACLLLFALLTGAAIGRYQRQLRSEGFARAKEFYFTSDFLDGGIHTLSPGSNSVTFTLGNHADELRYSEVDIAYKVEVTSDSTVTPAATVTKDTGTLEKGVRSDATVTISDLQPGTYTVEATATGGYEKTLTATIQVLSDDGQIYYHRDNFPDYMLLTVWNEGNTAGDVAISYTGIPDNTNPNMTDWSTAVGTETSKTVPIGAHESKVFRFFGGATVNVTGGTDKVPN